MKRILSIFLCAVIALSVLGVVSAAAEDGAVKLTDDGVYKYRVVNNEYVELLKCVSPQNADPNDDGSYSIPSEVEGYEVRVLGTNLFRNTDVPYDKVIIPPTVTEIKRQAFFHTFSLNRNGYIYDDDRSILTEVSIPDSVVTIGDSAFRGCHLKSLNIPSGVESIGNYAFSFTDIDKVTVPKSVKNLGAGVFSYCGNLRTAVIKAELTRLPSSIFEETGKLSVTLPDTIEVIGSDAFNYCLLDSINLPKHITEIESFAFYECSLNKAVLDETVSLGIAALAEDEVSYSSNFKAYFRYCEGQNKTYHKKLFENVARFPLDEVRNPCTYIIPNKNHNYNFKYNGKLRLKVEGVNATDWKSSNPKKIRITKSGVMTLLSKGKATITAKLPNGKTFKSTVRNFSAAELKLLKEPEEYDYIYEKLPKTLTLDVGESVQIMAYNKIPGSKITFKGSDVAKTTGKSTGSVVTVTALKRGTTTLKFVVNGQKLTQKVRVV